MATTKKKKVSSKKAAKKPARKISAKQASSSPRAALLGKNNHDRKLSPFVRKQKENLLQLRDAMVDSMAGVAQDTLRSRAEGSEASALECTRPMPAPMLTIAISRSACCHRNRTHFT